MSWLHLGLALLVLGFGAVFAALATGILLPIEDGRGGGAESGVPGTRLMAGGVAALALFMSVYLAATGLRGRQPGAEDERGRIAEGWSVADGGSVTIYRQAIGRGLVNLGGAVAVSLMILGFLVGGMLSGIIGLVAIAGVMGLLIVPFTVKGIIQFLFDPVVLELGRVGIRVRGHRRVPWADVKALRIEEQSASRRRRTQPAAESGPSGRRLGVALRHDPGGFSLLSAMSGGAYGRIGITEVELPVRIEEVLERARAYHPELEVEGSSTATAPAATPAAQAFEPERADSEPVRWQGATIVPALVRRRLLDAALSLPAQLASLVGIAIVLASSGAGDALPLVLGAFGVVLAGVHVVNSGIGTARAARAAAERRYTLTASFLVTESGEQRHERRLSGLPPLVLSMERGGIGTISYQLPRPAIPDWVRRLSVLPQQRTDVLLESIPDAERVFEMLRSGAPAPASAVGAAARPVLPAADASGPSEPLLLPARPWTLQRLGAWIPWWFGLPFFLAGLFTIFLGITSPRSGPVLVPLLFGAVFAAIGGWILWSGLAVVLTHRRLAASGTVVMARVIGLADANAETNGEDLWVVRYEYDAGGTTLSADSPPMSAGRAMRWAEGDRVRVAYDPSRPEDSIWLGGGPHGG
ncbi:MAG TPA: DUF3592 domain-containing protein [Candidatus Limnocylindria bacterium]